MLGRDCKLHWEKREQKSRQVAQCGNMETGAASDPDKNYYCKCRVSGLGILECTHVRINGQWTGKIPKLPFLMPINWSAIILIWLMHTCLDEFRDQILLHADVDCQLTDLLLGLNEPPFWILPQKAFPKADQFLSPAVCCDTKIKFRVPYQDSNPNMGRNKRLPAKTGIPRCLRSAHGDCHILNQGACPTIPKSYGPCWSHLFAYSDCPGSACISNNSYRTSISLPQSCGSRTQLLSTSSYESNYGTHFGVEMALEWSKESLWHVMKAYIWQSFCK